MSHRLPLMILCGALFVAPVEAAPKGQADDFSVDELKKIEAQRDKALKRLEKLEKSGKKADRELAEIDAELIAAAADSRRHEESALSIEARLENLVIEEKAAREALLKDEEVLEDVLATLMTFGSRRPPALAVSPDDAGDAVRAAILMGDITPKLAARAEALAAEIDKLAQLQVSITDQREDLVRTEGALIARRAQIEALYKEKHQKRRELAEEAAQLKSESQSLADEVDSLKDLLASIERAAPPRPSFKPAPPRITQIATQKKLPKPPPRALSPQRGHSLPPVTGQLIYAFGQPDDSTLPHNGQTWRTRSGAQVLAPQDARVKFAGEFRSYGQILILDVGDGYLVVLAGLGALYSQTGQSVLAGEPVGRMSDSVKTSPQLYIEVRRNGKLVDPGLWLDRNA